MPEMRFVIRWPDGAEQTCYSPSLVIKDYFAPGDVYSLDDFLKRSRAALTIASARVEAKYGMPCSRALGQLHALETKAEYYTGRPSPIVTCTAFIE
jgi:uncharacterized repeat protein (TIGR04042 family)